jgi:hypothetical protein
MTSLQIEKIRMNRDDLKAKAARYSAIAGSLAAGTVSGQVVLTDAKDTLIDFHNGYYDIDLNQDGQGDFRIRQYIETGVSGNVNAVVISPLGGNGHQVAGEFKLQFNYPFRFDVGDSLGPTQTVWNGTGLPFETGYMVYELDGATYPNSNWVGPVNDGYLGLRLRVTADDFLFGWARVSIAADNKSFIVHEFAYEESQNVPILAGNNLVGISPAMPPDVNFFVTTDAIRIANPAAIKGLEVALTDMRGQVLVEEKMTSTQFEIPTQGLAKGIYLLTFKYPEGFQSAKVLIR